MLESILRPLATLGADGPGWLISMTLWTGGLLALAWLADQLLRRRVSPAWRVVLYVAVFVRAALPVDWAAPLSPLSAAPAPTSTAVAATGAAAATGASAEAAALEAFIAPARLGTGGEASGLTQASSSVSPLSLVILGGYLLGVFMFLGAGVRARRRMRATLSEARPVASDIGSLAPDHAVLEHPVAGPLAYGVRRPVIILPSAALRSLSAEELACVVAHERAHHQRRDPLLVAALSLSTALLWPLLPVWIAAARIRGLIELAADELAVVHTSARLYGQTLLKLASAPARPRPRLVGALQLDGYAHLRGRLLALRRRRAWPKLAQAGAAISLGALALACAGIESAAPDDERCEEPVTKPGAVADAAACEQIKQRATQHHDQSERSNDAALRLLSLEAYDQHAETCQGDPDHAELLYYRAELLWAIASRTHASGDEQAARAAFARAREAFLRSLESGPGKFTEDAAFAQLLAKMNELGIDTPSAPSPRASADPVDARAPFPVTDYTDEERELLASFATFEQHVQDPNNKQLQRAHYTRATLAMEHNRFDEAARSAAALLDGSDGEQLHVWAAEILTDVLTIRMTDERAAPEDRARAAQELSDWIVRARQRAFFQRDEAAALREAFTVLEAGARWTHASAARDAGRDAECGETFTEIASRWPEHPQRDDAMINAARCWAQAGEASRRRQAARLLLRELPRSEHVAEARELAR